MGDPEKKEHLQRYLGHLVGKKNNGRDLKLEKRGRKQERAYQGLMVQAISSVIAECHSAVLVQIQSPALQWRQTGIPLVY